MTFKSKFLPAGYGEHNPLSTCNCLCPEGIEGEDCDQYCNKQCTGKDIIIQPHAHFDGEFIFYMKEDVRGEEGQEVGTKRDFIRWENQKNRRIEVKSIYK